MKNKIKRFERKWIFRNNNFITLVNALIRSNLFFRTQYPSRIVNSIYFDTNNYISIRQNLDGVSNKKKNQTMMVWKRRYNFKSCN